MNAFSHWSAHDWVVHYTGVPVEPRGFWDTRGRWIPAHATGQSLADRAQQAVQRAAQTAEHVAQRGQEALQSAEHTAARAAHEGYDRATSPKMLVAGLAALGILGWIVVQSGRTVGKTVEGVAPHAVKALPLLI